MSIAPHKFALPPYCRKLKFLRLDGLELHNVYTTFNENYTTCSNLRWRRKGIKPIRKDYGNTLKEGK
jgi:hypothetical protein